MKTAIIIIIVIISVALLVTGILYGEYPHTDHGKAVTLQEKHNTQTPEQRPNVLIEPMSGFSAY